MTYEIYRYIFLGGAILAGIMLGVSVFVFFRLKIPTVIGDLTGSNARKAIENIRNQNARASEKTSRLSLFDRERGNITGKMQTMNGSSPAEQETPKNAKGNTNRLRSGKIVNDTTVLSNAYESDDKTTLLGYESGANETTVLSHDNGANDTAILDSRNNTNDTTVLNAQVFRNEFFIEYEITYIHTDEVID